jgi:hypothetical protein
MTGLYVDPTDLRAKAIQIRDLQFSLAKDKVTVSDPDALSPTRTAVANLRENADHLYEYQIYGDREGWRLAETLDAVAAAYEQIDAESRASIEGNGSPPEPVVPKTNTLPAPEVPPAMTRRGTLMAGYMDIEQAQQELSDGDHGASLRAARDAWLATGTQLQSDAEKFSQPIPNWEGDAALQAYGTLKKFGEFLHQLGTSWHQLAGEAHVMSDKHIDALSRHTPIYQEYKELEAERDRLLSQPGGATGGGAHHLAEQMMDRQQRSDELREDYAHKVNPEQVDAPSAPNSTAPTAAVTQNGTPAQGCSGGGSGGGGTGSGGGGGGAPASSDPGTAQTSPMSADPSQQSKGGESGGEQSGGGSGGGESGGGSGGGEPSLPTGDDPSKGMPDTTGDPRLTPAADAGAGGGGSGGGGAGGGGAGAAPLQPSVSGVAVGPSPSAGGGTAGTAAPAAASSGSGMMGGMGGMPMGGGGHGAQSGTERKRTPGLSPDEELYTEDRPHTEGIIGRPERRAGQGKRDST